MLTRHSTSWTSIVKSKIWFLAIAISLLSGTAQAQWSLVDDFEGHTAGNAVAGVVGPGATWSGTTDPLFVKHTAEVDPANASNQAMKVSGRPRLSGDLDSLVRAELGASDFIASGDTGTLFYRFRTPVGVNGGQDHVVGLTNDNLIANFNFKSGLRYTVPDFVPPAPSATGTNNMDVRDGGSYVSVASLADDTWYKLWMVSTNDASAGTWDLYIQSDTDSNFATQTQVGTNVSYRTGQSNADPIINVYFRNANNDNGVDGNDLYFDDVYINSTAEDLTDPTATTTVILGDVDLSGTVDFLDIGPFITVLSGGTFQAEADCDMSGEVNFLDIGPFIDILSGP